jgi:hypothetical protein
MLFAEIFLCDDREYDASHRSNLQRVQVHTVQYNAVNVLVFTQRVL